jgi:hypothetical protein
MSGRQIPGFVTTFVTLFLTCASASAQMQRQHYGCRERCVRRGAAWRHHRSRQSRVDREVRTAVSDGQGLYRIVDLRPGTYTVTFTLPGFSTMKREGLELTAGFTATVNADMKVGELAETITVSGESPVVDLQNVRQADPRCRVPPSRRFRRRGASVSW